MGLKTNDELFVREFKDMMLARQSSNGAVASSFLQYLKYPDIMTGLDGIKGLDYYRVKGIPKIGYDMNYAMLNDNLVQVLNVIEISQKQRLADNTVAKNSKGEIVTKNIKVPKDSKVVLTTIKVTSSNGKSDSDLRLVDAIQKRNKTYFVYFIPKVFLYGVNLCSLVVTPNKQRQFYKGYCAALTTGIYMYLFVTPYKDNADETRQVVCTKSSFDFSKEITAIFEEWVNSNIMFNPKETQLEQGVEDVFRPGTHRQMLYNIGLLELEPTLLADDYTMNDILSLAQIEKNGKNQLEEET